MEILALTIALCFAVFMYFQERYKKKVAYSMHIQERTEEAETLDFGVVLYDDESFDQWALKLDRAYSIAEARRAFNNQRMIQANKQVMEEAQKARDDKKVVPLK